MRENQSRGTDQGSASIALLLGDLVPQPFLGAYPSLARLDGRADLVPSLSPPDLYRQALALWEPLIKTALSKESNLILLSETTMSRFCPDFAHSSPCKEVQAVSTTRFV